MWLHRESPSMRIIWPEIERPQSDAWNRISAAMSSGSTNLVIDWLDSASLVTSDIDLPLALALPSKTCWRLGPLTASGIIALTWMPASPSSIDSVLVKPMRPHFVVAYGLRFGYPIRPPSDDIMMMTPDPACLR
jgi:hypothetical protein